MAKKMSFEESIVRLEEIVRLLERGEAPLEESLTLFEESAGLVKRCTELLDKAEQTVIRLKKGPDGKPVELPFAAVEET